ncbi:hypothetical protein GGI04_004940 [Coemansia thaxteri]|nr:hypothetical protein GGI04_004940 [Coemansia thaxteri]KAJ2465157.1 hypothetical protein GGI02_004783 [Coemansia sp. RSA 2322]
MDIKGAPPTKVRDKSAPGTAAGGASSGPNVKPVVSGSDPSLLGRITQSATKLASTIAHGATQGRLVPGSDALAEAKTGQQAGSVSASQAWVAESSLTHDANTRHMPERQVLGDAAFAFRHHVRAAVRHDEQRYSEDGRRSTEHVDYKGKDTVHIPPSLQEPARPGNSEAGTGIHAESHQVGLAQGLDGQAVADFLSQTMPASMSVTQTRTSVHEQQPHLARQQILPRPETSGAVDPVAYLQGTTYAADMELLDHQVPQSLQEASSRHAPAASPLGMSRAWDEHGASVLEEWQLNEAWDRAWMDTTWGTTQKDAQAKPRAEPVLPSTKNLSNLLKPRI